MSPDDNTANVYMCGLELFGPYDMCDAYNDKGQNKYNCVGKLKAFREDHQSGSDSISDAIRTELLHRRVKFKGADEDAFVVIYHAQSPYANVHSYRAEDDNKYYRLGFNYNRGRFSRTQHFDNFNNATRYELSQSTSVQVKPDELYGYIHLLGDRTATYKPKSKSFDFPFIEEEE